MGVELAGELWWENDRQELELLGPMLDKSYARLGGRSAGVFLAEGLLKVRGKNGRIYPLRANAMQKAFERRRGAGNIVLKARQMGMTTWVAGRFLLKTITRPGTLTLLVAHTQESAEEILGIVHRFVEHLPGGLRAGALRTARKNVRQIVFPLIDSEYRVVSAAERNAGRGLTFQNLHCSEVSRWTGSGSANASETLAGLRAGLAPGGEQVLESTPNGAEGCFYEEWQGAELSGLVKHFFPWWMEKSYRDVPAAYESLTEEELELIAGHGLTLEQIGYRRRMRASLKGLAWQEMAEDAESCFRVSGEPYFELSGLETRLKMVGEPQEARENGMLEIWLKPVAGREYVVAVDPAGGGVEGDNSAIEVLDIETGIQCAEFAGHVAGLELARVIDRVAREFNQAWVVVERNNHGSGVLLMLVENLGYPRVYASGAGPHAQLGMLTTATSRPAMLARLAGALAETPELFWSRRLLAECRRFVRLPGGGMGARSGAHDDRVMAMAIGLAARLELLRRVPRFAS